MTTLHNPENTAFDISSIDFATVTDTAALPQPVAAPIKQATYKASTEDFVVDEILDIDFSGAGEHLWLHIQKLGMNTAYLAKLLSEWADIPLRDVGYSGLKDRQALTTQWFSLRIPKKQLPESEFAPVDTRENETIKILSQQWHHKKLNRGTHRANRFIITLRDIELGEDERLLTDSHLENISSHGVPNYFGTQRFGFGGNNIKEALAVFARPIHKRVAETTKQKKGKHKGAVREQNSMELSAARSLIFNEILAARVRDGSWNKGLDGEVFNLNGSGSIFASDEIDDSLRARLACADIHPTAVLWGSSNDKVTGKAWQLEQHVVKHSPLLSQLATGLEQREIKAQRRALRLLIEDLTWQWHSQGTDEQADKSVLTLSFTLTTGSFATSVLASVVRDLALS